MPNFSKVINLGHITSHNKFSVESYYKLKNYYNKKSNIKGSLFLKDFFENAKKQEGIIASSINKLIGQEKRCEKSIQDLAEGKIKFKKAKMLIEIYKQIQKTGMSVFSSFISAAAGTAVATGEALSAASICTIGAVGALTKIAVKSADRATNKIKGDALNKKKITMDGISGSACSLLPNTQELFEKINVIGASIGLKKLADKIFLKKIQK